MHETVLHINLKQLKDNLNFFKKKLKKSTEIIAIIKASAYGLGDVKIARFLESIKIKNFWVADFEEGITLRKSGITGSIIVANPGVKSISKIRDFNLEPVIFNQKLLNLYSTNKHEFNIHLKFNTGMNRYGFSCNEIKKITGTLKKSENLTVKSICSHLTSSDNHNEKNSTLNQIKLFNKITDKMSSGLKYPIKRHILNTNGILNYSEHQLEMVRIGIGLFGLNQQPELKEITKLTTSIAQIREINKGESVGYNNSFIANKKMLIAIVPVGYADGFNRKLGGKGFVLINKVKCPVIGQVSMDSFITDVSFANANEGDEVTIFGPNLTIHNLANMLDTIPYEILATINKRIKRIYIS